MKVLGKRVLVEQRMTKKKSSILIPEHASDSEKFDYEFEVLQLGSECPTGDNELQVGDIPVFSQHVVFQGNKLISKDNDGMVLHTIIHYDDIIGVDNDQGEPETSDENDSGLIVNPG